MKLLRLSCLSRILHALSLVQMDTLQISLIINAKPVTLHALFAAQLSARNALKASTLRRVHASQAAPTELMPTKQTEFVMTAMSHALFAA